MLLTFTLAACAQAQVIVESAKNKPAPGNLHAPRNQTSGSTESIEAGPASGVVTGRPSPPSYYSPPVMEDSTLLASPAPHTGQPHPAPYVLPAHRTPCGPRCTPQLNLKVAEKLAVDIARRTLLVHNACAANYPIRTAESSVRPQGDVVHLYARLIWQGGLLGWSTYESEVFATVVYTPNLRRVYELSYRDNCSVPLKNYDSTSKVITQYNTEFAGRDKFMMPHRDVGPDPDVLLPRSRTWRWNLLSGDRAWHAFNADDRTDSKWSGTTAPIRPE